ncbi:forkhead box protein I2-like [Ascaphus truei]|uniref:forkhead box protein I2-like n=1 Tax=Ascaphus truei TaxID=8439 RepID=UPI003F5902F9
MPFEMSSKEKSPFSYANIIYTAIQNRIEKHATVSQIYQYITENYPYYQNHPNPKSSDNITDRGVKITICRNRVHKEGLASGQGQYHICEGKTSSDNVRPRCPRASQYEEEKI